jgi:hypothetical protein
VLSSENKRLGDYAAGTIVVRDRTMEVYDPKRWLKGGAASMGVQNAQLALEPRELAVVELYLSRKTSLSPEAARQTAAKIAAMLRPKVSSELAALPDEDLIMRIGSRDS